MPETAHLAGPADAAAPPGLNGALAAQQFLRFALGEERYAVRIDAVREILEVTQMTPLPRLPQFVRGVMNLRGAVVPVVDLGARLGLPPTEVGRRTCVVIVDVGVPEEGAAQTMGMLVDAVYEVFDSALADQEAVPRLGTRIDPAFIRCMVRVRGQATPELDLQAILDQRALTDLIAQHRNH